MEVPFFTRETACFKSHSTTSIQPRDPPTSTASNPLETSGSGNNTQKQELARLWHARLGHLNYSSLSLMSKHTLGILQLLLLTGICEACQLGKHTRLTFPKVAENQALRPLEVIHSDPCGPLPKPSLRRAEYFLNFTDDHSRKTWIIFMKYKSPNIESNWLKDLHPSFRQRRRI